jgi:hypothetical protein
MNKLRAFVFSLILSLSLSLAAFGTNNNQPQTLSERLVAFIVNLLQPRSHEIDETLVRDHL